MGILINYKDWDIDNWKEVAEIIKVKEVELEKYIMDMMEKLGYIGNIKSDKKSLPYKSEVVVRRMWYGDNNDLVVFDKEFMRLIVKDLVADEAGIFRFYVEIAPFEVINEEGTAIIDDTMGKYGLEYRFRYFPRPAPN